MENELHRNNAYVDGFGKLTVTRLIGLIGIFVPLRGSPVRSMLITVCRGVLCFRGFFSENKNICH